MGHTKKNALHLETWFTLAKTVKTWNNGSHLEKKDKVERTGSHYEKWVTLGNMGHIVKTGHTLEQP